MIDAGQFLHRDVGQKVCERTGRTGEIFRADHEKGRLRDRRQLIGGEVTVVAL